MQGGKHSAAAYTELEKWAYGSVVSSLTSFVLSAGSGMNLNISTGAGLISDSIARRIGTDATESVTVPAASASFNRIDSVVAYIDTAVSPTTGVTDNTNDILKFVVVAGTASASPAAPTGSAIIAAIGAGKPYMVLWDVTVPQNAVNNSGMTFTDRRNVLTIIKAGQFAAGAIATADIANDAVTTAKVLDKAITTRKMKPSYAYVAGSTGGARQSITTGSYQSVQGASISYTSGPTTEILQIFGTCIANATAAGSQFLIGVNGTPVSKSDYDDQSGTFKGRFAHMLYEIAANTTVTISLMGKAASGTVAVGNAAADVTNAYSPHLGITAFGR